jgi:predicted phosphodiesterase
MKLHILSDIHLEFSDFSPPDTDADVIILAGDIAKVANGIHWSRRTFPNKPILYVPGNHEFYGTQRLETLAKLNIEAKSCDVFLLDDSEVIIDGVRFLGCTLWTDFLLFGEDQKPYAMRAGLQGLNDFRVIHEGRLGHFSPSHSITLHEKSLAWLKAKLNEKFVGKTVVITHHLPSKLSVADRFKNDLLSACFASELDHLFGMMDIWVHGHTHDNFDYIINGTRVICNPRGYVTYNGTENFDFNPKLVVEV